MTYLYLDIETVPNYNSKEEFFQIKKDIEEGKISPENNKEQFFKFKRGMFNPFEGKTIVITYQAGASEKIILKEWDSSEKEILQSFFNAVNGISREAWAKKDPLSVVGFNITAFDLPFLFARMLQHKIITSDISNDHNPKWVFEKVFHFPIDLMQAHLHLNDFVTTGVKHNTVAKAYGFQPKDDIGEKMAELYYSEKHKEIIDYVDKEFIYKPLLEKMIKNGLIEKEKFKKIVEEIIKNTGAKKAN